MKLYPVNIQIKNRLCVVIGGGKVGRRKAKALLEAGARVRIINLQSSIFNLQSKDIEVIERPYEKGDLEGAFLAIAATDDKEVNKQVAKDAKERGILVNVVDAPEIGDFFTTSVIRRGDLVVSISTGGKFPALSKKIREKFEEEFDRKVIGKYTDLSKCKQIG